MTTLRTPSQTIGPFFAIAFPRKGDEYVVPPGTRGGVWLRGRVFDGDGEPVPDAVVETWQADDSGALPGADATDEDSDQGGEIEFRGYGRSATDLEGRYAIFTIKPGELTGPDGRPERPRLDVLVFARGLLRHLLTRIYFPEDETIGDATLERLDDGLRQTLVARPAADGYEFDIRLQGNGETVFFAF